MHRFLWIFFPVFLAAVSLGPAFAADRDPACQAVRECVNREVDAGAALQRCLDHPPADGQVTLPPGVYRVLTPVRITRPLTVRTDGRDAADGRICARDGARDCAELVLDPRQVRETGAAQKADFPLVVASPRVTFDHIVISGSRGRDKSLDDAICENPAWRQRGGGLDVRGEDFRMTNSVVRNVPCLTAFSFARGRGLTVVNNWIGGNGDHTAHWADGLTVHEATEARIEHNTFVDNTDVQLIFGGCRACQVRGNRFLHSGAPSGGAFADLMLQAWPKGSSGDYSGSVFSGNTIDCGPAKRCGFGIMLGGEPWYRVPTFGGEVVDNVVTDAMVGLNIQNLSGPMTVRGNRVIRSGGRFMGACGQQEAAAVNIGQASRGFVDVGAIEASAGTRASALPLCILNYPPQRRVTTLYQELLGRKPDPSGLQFWVGRLEQGASIPDIRKGILQSPESEAAIKTALRRALRRDATSQEVAAARQRLMTGTPLTTLQAAEPSR